ncbi:hypothetical protein CALCODRAFT_522978 [Calocera cornea HHB12733]|uniref:tRNA-splicing endonuclease subunit Sen34 n=1 Tax=Calocera cornea HHB12733 TaxID=1353952 RepID=A0A165IBT8_9BASI|nr:hypothetical protein CALCODRAFT_522978 [Calocera cornea HHB12733]
MSSPHAPAPVPIHISGTQALVWSVDDIATLRTQHRICGSLVGTLPAAAQQNVFLGVPLLLAREEVVLLVERQLAVLVDERASYPAPSARQFQEWASARREEVVQQQKQREARERRPPPVLGEEALRRREEREARRERERAARAAKAAEEGEELLEDKDGVLPQEQDQPAAAAAALDKSKGKAPEKDPAHWVTIPSSSLSLPWYTPRTYATLAAARSAGLWTYPTTRGERAKCAAFRALWERGHYLGPGLKFGGDWLVYPGDPLRYHSHFVATALAGRDGTVRPMEVIAFGRLGTATKKAHLLCGWDEGTGQVSFFSIEWANFG